MFKYASEVYRCMVGAKEDVRKAIIELQLDLHKVDLAFVGSLKQ